MCGTQDLLSCAVQLNEGGLAGSWQMNQPCCWLWKGRGCTSGAALGSCTSRSTRAPRPGKGGKSPVHKEDQMERPSLLQDMERVAGHPPWWG